MSVIIGIDPHKSTHTAVAIDRDEHPLARLQVAADRARPSGCWRGRHRSARTGPGRSSPLAGSASCWLSSCRVPASTSSMFHRRCRRGCGCWARPRHRRTTPTTRCRRRSPGYVTAICARSPSTITARCCACCSTATTTWRRAAHPGGVPAPRACCASSSPVAHPALCRPIEPPSCCAASTPTAVAVERKRLALELLADIRRLDRDIAAARSPHHRRRRGLRHDADRIARRRPDRRRRSSSVTSATRPGSRPPTSSPPTTAPPRSRRPAGRQASSAQPARQPQTQPCHPHGRGHPVRHDTPGRAYYRPQARRGQDRKEALRALKRRISDAVWRQLQVDPDRH